MWIIIMINTTRSIWQKIRLTKFRCPDIFHVVVWPPHCPWHLDRTWPLLALSHSSTCLWGLRGSDRWVWSPPFLKGFNSLTLKEYSVIPSRHPKICMSWVKLWKCENLLCLHLEVSTNNLWVTLETHCSPNQNSRFT